MATVSDETVRIEVRTRPESALYRDGARVGATPHTLELEPSELPVVLEARTPRHRTERIEIDGSVTEIQRTLTRRRAKRAPMDMRSEMNTDETPQFDLFMMSTTM